MSMVTNLLGARFGRLLVTRRAENTSAQKARWTCQCDCGQTKVVSAASLRGGETNSCGCIKREQMSLLNLKHGAAVKGSQYFREFCAWREAKRRCEYSKHHAYADYGGRGIMMCPEWSADFLAFLRDMGPCAPGLTLERKDNDGPYSPSNCTWATRLQQARNRRTRRLLTCQGETKSLSEWAETTGLTKTTIASRLARGWSTDDALLKPPI